MENCTDLNLVKDLSTLNFRSFHFPDPGPYLLNGFDIDFIFNGMTVKISNSPVRVQLIKTDNCKPTDNLMDNCQLILMWIGSG